jgi:ATP-dependent RNA helicase DeaD
MLRAIERATRQPIEPMRAPSLHAIAGRRVQQFKQAVAEHLGHEDIDYFETLVREIAEENDSNPERVAAALAFMVQRARPLRVVPGGPRVAEESAPATRPEAQSPIPPPVAHERPARRPPPFAEQRETREPREERRPPFEPEAQERQPRFAPDIDPHAAPLKDHPEIEMVRYRIDVGHLQGATPKHIVGAIANEAGIESRFIGRIDIFDDFSTVDLPGGMPKDLLQHLKKVRLGKFRFNMAPLLEPTPPARPTRAPARLADGERPPPRAKARKPQRPPPRGGRGG